MSKGKILIVEPDDDIRKMIESYFTKHGYSIEAVSNGTVAASLIQNNPLPDILLVATSISDMHHILMDLQIQDFRLPVVFLSTIKELDSLMGRLGFFEPHDVVTKPFDIEELRLRVEKVLLQTKS